ncbi:MAG: hypothetical protein ABI806_24250 [Candidatus Solibacter sp.]
MTEWSETRLQVEVQPAEYLRLLGYPAGFVLEGRARELADGAQSWYAEHGRPWLYAREIQGSAVSGASVQLEGERFHSAALGERFACSQAGGAVLAALSAGTEVEAEAQRLWLDERPDEYYFMEVLGSAVVERMAAMAGARLCEWADTRNLAVLPHYSPGYPDWDIGEQGRLLALLKNSAKVPGEIEALESGALKPKKSLLAVFGLAPATAGVKRLTDTTPCENCTLPGCRFRRVSYAVNSKALRKWARERLTLTAAADGGIEAQFLYEGTTCTNMGRALRFEYRVKLGPREAGYPIVDQECVPEPGDTGHRFMCRYLEQGEALMTTIAGERPLRGQRLDEALQWERPATGAGCYCEAASRAHKWGLALETIHYALAQRDIGNE